MNKYRIISVWSEAYVPKNYRQDGVKQERVEDCGLTLEEATKKFYELFNPKIKEGWAIDRYEIDDGLYRNFELIGSKPKISEPAEKEEVKDITIEVTPSKTEEPVFIDIVPVKTVIIEQAVKVGADVEMGAKAAKSANEPFCRCLYEIENNLKVSNYCDMACKDQGKILQKRKQEKRLKEEEASGGNKTCQ